MFGYVRETSEVLCSPAPGDTCDADVILKRGETDSDKAAALPAASAQQIFEVYVQREVVLSGN